MYKLLNKRLETVKLAELTEATREDVEAVQQGEYTICPHWEAVEALLDCFPAEDNEDWRIEELSHGMFAILPKYTTAQQRNKFEKLLKE